jgi:mannose-6-phosphate isomerase-like protein (cupin superfamily)
MQDPPQGGNPLHVVHPYDLGCCVLEGEYAIQVGDRVRMASRGSFVFVPRGTSVGWTNLGATIGKILLIISPAGLERAIEETFYARDAASRTAIYERYGVEMSGPMTAVQRPPTREGGAGAQSGDALVSQRPGKMFRLGTAVFILQAAGEDTRGAYTLFETRNPPRDGPPLHVHHREDEGFYILEGEYIFRVGDRTFSATPGSFLLAPKEVPHRYVQVSPAGGRYLVVTSPPGFENFVAAAAEPISDSSTAPTVPDAVVLERIREQGRRFGIDTLEESGVAGAFPPGL